MGDYSSGSIGAATYGNSLHSASGLVDLWEGLAGSIR